MSCLAPSSTSLRKIPEELWAGKWKTLQACSSFSLPSATKAVLECPAQIAPFLPLSFHKHLVKLSAAELAWLLGSSDV
jgi:hypothetical protein